MTRVSDTDFVRACVASSSNAELAIATGLTALSAQARANKMRKAGVNLPRYSRIRTKKVIDVDGLNALIPTATN